MDHTGDTTFYAHCLPHRFTRPIRCAYTCASSATSDCFRRLGLGRWRRRLTYQPLPVPL